MNVRWNEAVFSLSFLLQENPPVRYHDFFPPNVRIFIPNGLHPKPLRLHPELSIIYDTHRKIRKSIKRKSESND